MPAARKEYREPRNCRTRHPARPDPYIASRASGTYVAFTAAAPEVRQSRPTDPAARLLVGDVLAQLFHDIHGAVAADDCPCKATLRRMNQLGPTGCSENQAELIEEVRQNASSYGAWLHSLAANWMRRTFRTEVSRLLRNAIETVRTAWQAMPWPDNVTIAVTAYERPELLTRCLRSIWRRYPTARVIVADNGTRPIDAAAIAPAADQVEYLQLETDCGVSVARNVLAAACSSPYMLQIEEDMIFDERLQPARMLDVLESSPEIALVTQAQEESYRGPLRGGAYALHLGRLIPRYDLPRHHTPRGSTYTLCELADNCYIARTQWLRRHPWPAEYKIGEHWRWAREQQIKQPAAFANCLDSQIGHDPARTVRAGASPTYEAGRARAARYYHKRAVRELGADQPTRLAPDRSRCVLVIGTGRSGTSAIAGTLHRLGIFMGYEFVAADHTNPAG
ncbi:MAG: glycosyltransferase, partial [Planctomycetaceae bacterium]